MNNKHIKDTFEFFSPTEEQKEKIYQSIVSNKKTNVKQKGLHFKSKLAYSLVAFSILATVAVVLLNSSINNSKTLLEPDNAQYHQSNKPSDNNSLSAVTDKKAMFKGFVLTTYTANSKDTYLSANFMDEAEKQMLTPDVTVLLATYSPAMSHVPGLPFTVDITNDDKNNRDIQAINISVDIGKLNKWNAETGVVSSIGQSNTIGIGETIYWSPINNEDDANANRITITIEAVKNDSVIGRQNIYITQVKPGYYSATVGALELL